MTPLSIPREYFKLDSECANRPSKFTFELLIDNTCYEFSFSVTQNHVVEEKLITPNTQFAGFGQFTQEGLPLYFLMNNADLSENGSAMEPQHRIILTKKNGALSAKKLVSYHKSFGKNDIPFDINQESAGTLRMIDILPCFFELFEHKSPKVCVIDELDRCLHTLLTRSLLEAYFSSCSQETRSQLLFTTHDALLIDQELFRRDEIWVPECDNRGCTSLISFGEYKKIRFDKDIRKSYLQGHLGGIPKIQPLFT